MNSHQLPFVAKIITANRITIPKGIMDALDLTEGDTVQISISKVIKIMKKEKMEVPVSS